MSNPRNPPPISRRGRPSSPASPPRPQLARGATARSAASPRVSSSLNGAAARRGSIKGAPNPVDLDAQETLSASLKRETEQKEQLMVQVQDKDQTISTMRSENDQLVSALRIAETRLNELYADQSRTELEMAQRIDISEKLREQVREAEKERRDIQRRYNEQTTTFEAERQAFYDNEQHLKSRIHSLTQARKQRDIPPVAEEPEGSQDALEEASVHERPTTPQQDLNDPEQEPAEMTSLRLELSTLATSHTSLQSTLVLLQTQLVDLKRVNHELQEENESYMILLREKTLSGQYNVGKQVGAGGGDDDDELDSEAQSLRSMGRSTLNRVEEEPLDTLEQQLARSMEVEDESDSVSSPRRKRDGSTSSSQRAPRGESLADLPISGPGLDLAAELGRAENKDILDGDRVDETDRSVKNKRDRKTNQGKTTTGGQGILEASSTNDVDALRSEVKALKDANKALSLYASKIIDRIIAQDGFEHVLSIDYEKEPPTPSTATATKNPLSLLKPRPQSVFMGRSQSNEDSSSPKPDGSPAPSLVRPNPTNPKTNRRSLSFDWRGFSLFNSDRKPDPPNLKPLTLKPGATLTSARKLETQEDEEDVRERERLHATMKLMGIQPAAPVSPALIQKSQSSPVPSQTSSPRPLNRRFSLFGSKTPAADTSETSSIRSSQSNREPADLTREALERAEAENSLAALDAHERNLSAELAKGSGSGFTDVPRKGSSRRGRRSAGGSVHSGSTVWSAGIEEDE